MDDLWELKLLLEGCEIMKASFMSRCCCRIPFLCLHKPVFFIATALALTLICGCTPKVKPRLFEVFLNSSIGHLNRVELAHPSGEFTSISVNPKGPEQTVFPFSVKSPGAHFFRVINDYGDCVFAAPIDTDKFGSNSTLVEVKLPSNFGMDVILPVLPGMREGYRGDDLQLKVTKIDDPCGSFGWSITDSNPYVDEKVVQARIYALTPGQYRFRLMQDRRVVIDFTYLITDKDSSFTLEHSTQPWPAEK